MSSSSTPLYAAARNAHLEAVRVLVGAGAKLEMTLRTAFGYTPLMKAAREGHKEVVRLLLEHGADRTMKDNFDGETARELAEDDRDGDSEKYEWGDEFWEQGEARPGSVVVT